MENLIIDKEQWTPVRFGDVVAEPKESVKNIADSNLEHVVGLEHIDPESIHLRRSAGIEESTTFTKHFSIGDVLFGRRRAYLKKAAQAPFEGICSGDITVFRAKERLLPELLPWIVQNEKFFDYAVKHSAGGLSPRVKFKDLANYEFLLPPKDQQAQLAELLWAMDEVIEKELRVWNDTTLYKESLQKKLYQDKVQNKVRLKKYCNILGGYAFSSKKFKDSGIPVIKIKNIVNGRIQIDAKENFIDEDDFTRIEKFKLSPGDMLIAMTGATLGKVGIIQNGIDKAYVNQRVGKFVVKNESYRSCLYGLFDSKYFQYELNKYIGAGAQGNISAQDIEKCLVPNLSKGDMVKFGSQFSSIYDSLEVLKTKINLSKSLQKSLINTTWKVI